MTTAGLTSVIVVAADSGATLAECAARVLASAAPVELVVADNASTDGAVAALAARYAADARVRILHNSKNIGFGPACNRAAAQARGDALLILNPDCYLETGTVGALRALVEIDTGLIGVCVCEPDGRPARAIRRREPTLRRALMTLSGLARHEAKHPGWAGIELPPAPTGAARENVEAVSGALMYVPRAAFERVGGFDAEYFLHCEDLDLCRRLRDAGLRVQYASGIRVTHVQGSSSRHRPVFVAWHKHRSMWRYFRKFDPAARHPWVRGLVYGGVWLHFAALMPVYLLRGFSAAKRRRR